MDLRLFWGVIKRYRRVAIGGTLVALVLATLTYGTPGLVNGTPTIVPRTPAAYESRAELIITQYNGVYGRADARTLATGAPSFLSSLSPVYAGLANGSVVQAAVRASRIPGTIAATEGVDPNTGDYTPFLNITTSGPTPVDAERLMRIGITAFDKYIAQMENSSAVPQSARVDLQVVRSGFPAVLASGHKVTLPLLVFVVVIAALIALMFSLENKDPQTAVMLGRVAGGPILSGVGGDGTAVATPEFSTAAAGHGAERAPSPGDVSRPGVRGRLYRPGLTEKLKRP